MADENLRVKWNCVETIRSCSRVRPPTKLVLSVKIHAPTMNSTTHLPYVCDSPSSGLNDQRLVPRLMTFAGSYCPSGGTATRLTPTMRSWRYDANWRGV